MISSSSPNKDTDRTKDQVSNQELGATMNKENEKPRFKKTIGNYYYYEDELIGSGSNSKVYKGYQKSNEDIVAIKVIPSSRYSETTIKAMYKEAQILSQIKNDYVVKLFDFCRTSDNFYLIMEYCANGNLRKYVNSKGRLPEKQALIMMYQIAKGFTGLATIENPNNKIYTMTIMHRDLKPENILLHDGQVKIADFGYSKMIETVVKDFKMIQTFCGSQYYSSPQILANEPYSYKCDIWSAGCILYEALFGKLPFTGETEVMLMNMINKGLTFPDKIKVTEETKSLLKRMLSTEELRRPDWEKMLEHPAFKPIFAKSPEENQ